MIRVGVIGLGYAAKTFHLPLLQASEHFQISAISTSQKEAATTLLPGVEIYSDASQLIQQTNLDLIVITAPNAMHFPLAEQALQQGLHVVVEKPLTHTRKEGEELKKLADSQGKILTVFHNRRWDGDFLTLKSIIESGELGDIKYLESRFDRFRPHVRDRWREKAGPGSGIWHDLGAHLVDQSLCLFGFPSAVTARCLPLRDRAETTDYFHVQLHYPNHEVVLHGSSFSAGPPQRFRLEGIKGSYVKQYLDPQENQLKNGTSLFDEDFGVEPSEYIGELHTETNSRHIPTLKGDYKAFYTSLASSIKNGIAPPVVASEAIAVLKILELADESQKKGMTLYLPP